jgi:hypothetical protein
MSGVGWRLRVEAPASRNGGGSCVERRAMGLRCVALVCRRITVEQGGWHSATSGAKRIVDVVHETVRCP